MSSKNPSPPGNRNPPAGSAQSQTDCWPELPTEFCIPSHLLPIRLSTIGASKRLLTVLARLRKQFVGDLDSLSARDLFKVDPRRGGELMTELVELIQNLAARIQSLNSSSTDPPPSPLPRRHYYRRKHHQSSRPSLPSGAS